MIEAYQFQLLMMVRLVWLPVRTEFFFFCKLNKKNNWPNIPYFLKLKIPECLIKILAFIWRRVHTFLDWFWLSPSLKVIKKKGGNWNRFPLHPYCLRGGGEGGRCIFKKGACLTLCSRGGYFLECGHSLEEIQCFYFNNNKKCYFYEWLVRKYGYIIQNRSWWQRKQRHKHVLP